MGESVAGTLAEVFDRYQAEVIPTKAEATQRSNRQELKKLRAVFGMVHPAEVTAQHVYRYLDERGKASKTQANREKALLSHVFSYCIRWGLVAANPCAGVHGHSLKPRSRYVTDLELWRAMRRMPKRARYACWLAYLTGLRRGDLLALTRFQLGKEGIEVTEGKTGKRVVIAWSRPLRRVVDRLQAASADARLFPITTSSFDTAWQRAMLKVQAAGIERFQIKDLRAKHASDFETAGGDATTQLGHSARAITLRHYLRRPRKVTPIRR
jgi:integrase